MIPNLYLYPFSFHTFVRHTLCWTIRLYLLAVQKNERHGSDILNVVNETLVFKSAHVFSLWHFASDKILKSFSYRRAHTHTQSNVCDSKPNGYKSHVWHTVVIKKNWKHWCRPYRKPQTVCYQPKNSIQSLNRPKKADRMESESTNVKTTTKYAIFSSVVQKSIGFYLSCS